MSSSCKRMLLLGPHARRALALLVLEAGPPRNLYDSMPSAAQRSLYKLSECDPLFRHRSLPNTPCPFSTSPFNPLNTLVPRPADALGDVKIQRFRFLMCKEKSWVARHREHSSKRLPRRTETKNNKLLPPPIKHAAQVLAVRLMLSDIAAAYHVGPSATSAVLRRPSALDAIADTADEFLRDPTSYQSD